MLVALSGFVQTIPPKPPNSNSRVPQWVKWKPPLRSYFKINFYRVVFKKENVAGIGDVIRDEKGHVMASMAEKILLPNSVAIVEAMAITKALTFA